MKDKVYQAVSDYLSTKKKRRRVAGKKKNQDKTKLLFKETL